MDDPGDDATPWARAQEGALRVELAAARAELERLERLAGAGVDQRALVNRAAAGLAAARTHKQRVLAAQGWSARRVGALVTGRHGRVVARGREDLAAAEAAEAEARRALQEARDVDVADGVDVTTARGLAEQRLARALDAIADRVVALEADGAGEIAELRRRTARERDEIRSVRSALARAGSSEVTLGWASGQLARAATKAGRRRRTLSDVLVDPETSMSESAVREATGAPSVDLDAVAAAAVQVESELAELREATIRIGLEGAGAAAPGVAFPAPRLSDDEAIRAAQQRVDVAHRWVQGVQEKLQSRVRLAGVREQQAHERIRAIVSDHLGDA